MIESLSSRIRTHAGRRSRAVRFSWMCLGVLVVASWLTVNACGGSTPPTIASSTEWAAPPPSVLAAFERATETLGRPAYVPSELPLGVRMLSEEEPPSPLESMSAESVITLAVGDGRLDVLQGIDGDLGDVQGTSCGTVDGRPAKVFDLLAGHLVQWEQGGSWYGVYGVDLPSETIVRVALSMVRG